MKLRLENGLSASLSGYISLPTERAIHEVHSIVEKNASSLIYLRQLKYL